MQQTHQEIIDSLLEQYLHFLDEYMQLRSQLSAHQTSIFQNLARANFAAPRGLRYGQDQYDQRMQASRLVSMCSSDTEFTLGSLCVVKASTMGNVAGGDTGNTPGLENDDKETPHEPMQSTLAGRKDPLRWFGLLTPPSLKEAQTSSVQVVEGVIPNLARVNAEMLRLEIEIRRARKKRDKATVSKTPLQEPAIVSKVQ